MLIEVINWEWMHKIFLAITYHFVSDMRIIMFIVTNAVNSMT